MRKYALLRTIGAVATQAMQNTKLGGWRCVATRWGMSDFGEALYRETGVYVCVCFVLLEQTDNNTIYSNRVCQFW